MYKHMLVKTLEYKTYSMDQNVVELMDSTRLLTMATENNMKE